MLAAGVVAAVGLAGLIRGAVPQAAAGGGTGIVGTEPIVVSGAYVREPASPDVAAAYFTIYNTTRSDDTLTSVSTGAGESAVVQIDDKATMKVLPGGLRVPAFGSVTFAPGKAHVMIEHLLGPLRAGQTVNLELQFANAGPVDVQARVIAINAPAPTSIPTR